MGECAPLKGYVPLLMWALHFLDMVWSLDGGLLSADWCAGSINIGCVSAQLRDAVLHAMLAEHSH